MADISAIADAIAVKVATISTLTNRVSAWGKDAIDPPWAIVVPDSGEFIHFDDTQDRLDSLTFLIKVFETGGEDRASQARLTSYLDTSGSSSVKAVVDGNLGGSVGISYARVVSARGFGEVTYAGLQYPGCEFVVEVKL